MCTIKNLKLKFEQSYLIKDKCTMTKTTKVKRHKVGFVERRKENCSSTFFQRIMIQKENNITRFISSMIFCQKQSMHSWIWPPRCICFSRKDDTWELDFGKISLHKTIYITHQHILCFIFLIHTSLNHT